MVKRYLSSLWSGPYDSYELNRKWGGPNSDMGRRVETVNGKLEVDDEERKGCLESGRVWAWARTFSSLFISSLIIFIAYNKYIYYVYIYIIYIIIYIPRNNFICSFNRSARSASPSAAWHVGRIRRSTYKITTIKNVEGGQRSRFEDDAEGALGRATRSLRAPGGAPSDRRYERPQSFFPPFSTFLSLTSPHPLRKEKQKSFYWQFWNPRFTCKSYATM